MSQNATPEVTEAEVRAAEAAEQAELNQAQTKHLLNRVVLLRVNFERSQRELAEAQERIRNLEEQLGTDAEPEEDDGTN